MPKIIQEDTMVGDILHHWTIQEYQHYERDKSWYIFMITIGLFLVLYGIFTGNFLFSLVIILAAIIIFIQSNQAAPQVDFGITDLGVIISNRFYPYSELDNFYIIYNPPEVKTLFFQTKSALRPKLRIPLLDMNPMDVRFSLKAHLEEDTEKSEEEPLADMVVRRWKLH